MVIKKRPVASEDLIEKFADGADDRAPSNDEVNRNAKRDYKAIRVPFNKYEFDQLQRGVDLSSRSKLNFIRYAILKLTKELEEEKLL